MKINLRRDLIVMALALAATPIWSREVKNSEQSSEEISQIDPNQKADGEQDLSVSMEQAVSYAVDHNRTLANASLDVQKAEMQRWQAIAKMLPQADASLQYSNMFGYKMDFGAMSIAMPPTGSIGVTVAAGVSAQGIVGAQIQRITKEMMQVKVKKTEQEIKSNTETMYIGILALEESVNLLKENMENLNKLKVMTENALKAGAAEQNDVNQLSIKVASMINNVSTQNNEIQMQYSTLLVLLGAPIETHLVLTQKLSDVLNEESVMSLLTSDLDLENNYDFQLLQKQTEITDKQKTMAVCAFLPSLSAAYQYTGKHYFSDDPKLDMTPPNTFNLTLKVPIFSSGVRTTAVKEAKLSQQQNSNTNEEKVTNLRVQEKQLKYNLASAYDNYRIQRENIKVMEQVFNSYSEKFKYGTASSKDINDMSDRLVEAQRNYVNSIQRVVNAQVELKKLLNK